MLRRKPLRQSIGTKIFGLAVLLLLLTLALASVLLFEVAGTRRHLRIVADFDVPLARTISQIAECGARRRLAYERLYGEFASVHPNEKVIAESNKVYSLFTAKLTEDLARAHELLNAHPQQSELQEDLVELRTLLDQVEVEVPAITARQREVLDLQRAHKFDEVEKRIGLLTDLERPVQDQRERLQNVVAEMSQISAEAAAQRERYVLWLTIAATASTVLLGLTVATIITSRLTQPVRSLAAAINDVQKGNLEVQLPVRSTDELGVLTGAFNFFVQEMRSKEQIKRTFGKYLDPRVLEYVLSQPGAGGATGGREVMTVLFADLVGFTSLSERLTPSRMVTLLNQHFGRQAEAVQEHRGVVDKFIGDAIMAFWGPPFVLAEEHAMLACRAALTQLAAMEALRRELSEITGLRKETPVVDLRVGICSGEVIVGNIGSENTRSYTVIGDTVNLASRLESANRVYGTRILVAEPTAQAVSGHFELREVDVIEVKGKTESTRVFELLGGVGQVPEACLRLRESFCKGLAAYRARDWDSAEAAIHECLSCRPDDGPSNRFLHRIKILRQTPPSADWNGVWALDEK
jgi:adenylate cyclase